MLRRALATLALALVAGACSSEAESFTLHLTWRAAAPYACPTDLDGFATCAQIPISCGARVLVRILPRDEGGLPYYSQCYQLEEATDACALAELGILPSQPIPNEMVRVQVAVWSDAQLGGGECPEDVAFDDFGNPSFAGVADPLLVPALGGEIYFPVGDRREARVPLACPRPDQLAVDACRGNPIVYATVREPLSFATVVPDIADRIDVNFGAPVPDGVGGWTLHTGLERLVRATGASDAVWSRRLEQDVPAVGCVETSLSETSATRAATCQDAVDHDGRVDVTGFVVRKSLVAQLLRALDLADVPSTGLVLGVVIDHLNRPVAGAKVTVAPTTPIAYPTAAFDHVGLDSTSSTGIFLSTDAPFDTAWSATDASGVRDDGKARGGLITDHVSVVIIRLNAPLGARESAQ